MSLLTEANFGNSLPIDGYGPGFFRVAGEVHSGNLWLMADRKGVWGGFDDTASLLALAGQIDLLFIGTGAELSHLPHEMLDTLEERGIMCEAMATPTAARSYNVLLSEGRRIGCALLAMPDAG